MPRTVDIISQRHLATFALPATPVPNYGYGGSPIPSLRGDFVRDFVAEVAHRADSPASANLYRGSLSAAATPLPAVVLCCPAKEEDVSLSAPSPAAPCCDTGSRYSNLSRDDVERRTTMPPHVENVCVPDDDSARWETRAHASMTQTIGHRTLKLKGTPLFSPCSYWEHVCESELMAFSRSSCSSAGTSMPLLSDSCYDLSASHSVDESRDMSVASADVSLVSATPSFT